MRRPSVCVLMALCAGASGVGARGARAEEPLLVEGRLVFPEGAKIPKGPSLLESALEETRGLGGARGFTPPPIGPVRCPGEYEPAQGIIIAWEGGATFTSILARMATHITTTGAADVYIMCDSASEATTATSTIAALTSPSANMSRVFTFVISTDTIWCRDYGPRYIYEGNVRAIVDHTYNRPSRTLDDALPINWAAQRRHPRYEIPLVHGGGNFHLNGTGQSFATRLIANENPGRSEAQIIADWQGYQNVTTTITDPFPVSVDSTQHIDMWVQVAGDLKVMVSDWASPPATNPNVDSICDAFASARQSAGWTVQRVPAFSVGGTHYTYTNVVICNNLILVPSYTNGTVSPSNAGALTAWQTLRPDASVVSVPCQAIVTSAGVMHCIVMHVPAPLGGVNPSVYLRSLRGPATLQPGASADITWSTDDDQGVSNVDILLSTDGGATFPTIIASATPDDGLFTWTVPGTYTTSGRIRVVARDAQGNTGSDSSTGDLFINGVAPGPCLGDANGTRSVDFADITTILSNFASGGPAFRPGDSNGSGVVDFADITTTLSNFNLTCP